MRANACNVFLARSGSCHKPAPSTVGARNPAKQPVTRTSHGGRVDADRTSGCVVAQAVDQDEPHSSRRAGFGRHARVGKGAGELGGGHLCPPIAGADRPLFAADLLAVCGPDAIPALPVGQGLVHGLAADPLCAEQRLCLADSAKVRAAIACGNRVFDAHHRLLVSAIGRSP